MNKLRIVKMCIDCKKVLVEWTPKYCCPGTMQSECGCMGYPINEDECICKSCKEKYEGNNTEASNTYEISYEIYEDRNKIEIEIEIEDLPF